MKKTTAILAVTAIAFAASSAFAQRDIQPILPPWAGEFAVQDPGQRTKDMEHQRHMQMRLVFVLPRLEGNRHGPAKTCVSFAPTLTLFGKPLGLVIHQLQQMRLARPPFTKHANHQRVVAQFDFIDFVFFKRGFNVALQGIRIRAVTQSVAVRFCPVASHVVPP